MNEQDQKAFKLYGKVPGKNLLTKMQKASILKNAWARAYRLTVGYRSENTLTLVIT